MSVQISTMQLGVGISENVPSCLRLLQGRYAKIYCHFNLHCVWLRCRWFACHVSRSTWDHGNTWSPSQTATSLYSHHCLCLMDRSSGGSCFLGYLFRQPGQTLIFPEILHRMNREGGVYWGWGVTKILGVQLVMASVHIHTAVHKGMGSLPQIYCGFEDMTTEMYWIGVVGIHCMRHGK